MPEKQKSDLKSRYESNSLLAERFALLVLAGLAVEIIEVFGLRRPFWEAVFSITATALILIGVWGEIIFEKRAKEAGDGIVAEANKQAEEAQLATEKLRAENLRLQMVLQPRTILIFGRNNDAPIRGQRLEELKRHAGTQLLIQVVPDLEAQKLAAGIRDLAGFIGWNAKDVAAVPVGRIGEGVAIVTIEPPSPATDIRMKMPRGVKALLEFLQLDLGPPYGPMLPFSVMWMPVIKGTEWFGLGDFKLPDGAILVLVGMKPITMAFMGDAPSAPGTHIK